MKQAKDTSHWGRATAKERHGGGSGPKSVGPLDDHASANNLQAPQDTQDKHDTGYDNDTSGWVNGKGEPYPNFDKGNAWRGGKLRD